MPEIFADFLPITQFAKQARRHTRTVLRWMDQRDGLPFVRLGNQRLIHVPTAREWLLKKMRRPNSDRRGREAEDRTEKHPVTPGVPTPARELYGTMLLEQGMAKEALAAFEATLKKEPHRLGATLGAAAAAEKLGDAAKAREHYAEAVALTENADPVRPQIAQAREFVARGPR
jgi:tetratricopeptide (TPR) repeat protein